ncbi:unnamed protein product [Prorocentrum cordatum]|uniref:Amino acid transporter transmembrane domain-containing protein n=1 Tax=Prorocentrum cordatum TaxID=2364126 RepID=A0ABN9XKI0_9DINO|nr:unnamed protein product [Polarella glacialis]
MEHGGDRDGLHEELAEDAGHRWRPAEDGGAAPFAVLQCPPLPATDDDARLSQHRAVLGVAANLLGVGVLAMPRAMAQAGLLTGLAVALAMAAVMKETHPPDAASGGRGRVLLWPVVLSRARQERPGAAGRAGRHAVGHPAVQLWAPGRPARRAGGHPDPAVAGRVRAPPQRGLAGAGGGRGGRAVPPWGGAARPQALAAPGIRVRRRRGAGPAAPPADLLRRPGCRWRRRRRRGRRREPPLRRAPRAAQRRRAAGVAVLPARGRAGRPAAAARPGRGGFRRAAPLATLVGAVGYLRFGGSVQGNVFASFAAPRDADGWRWPALLVARAALAVVLVVSFGCTSVPCRAAALEVFAARRTAGGAASRKEYRALAAVLALCALAAWLVEDVSWLLGFLGAWAAGPLGLVLPALVSMEHHRRSEGRPALSVSNLRETCCLALSALLILGSIGSFLEFAFRHPAGSRGHRAVVTDLHGLRKR